jgi:hypothetical protein
MPEHRPTVSTPGRFWSGDRLNLTGGASLGQEIAVTVAN